MSLSIMGILTDMKLTLCLNVLEPKLVVSRRWFMVPAIYSTGICAKH